MSISKAGDTFVYAGEWIEFVGSLQSLKFIAEGDNAQLDVHYYG